MAKKLKDILQNSDDLFLIHITKGNPHDKSTWQFKIIDPRWKGKPLGNTKMKSVYLRRGNCFFIAYKTDDSFAYFVDEKKCLFRNSIQKYVTSQLNYQVYSNDISITKNEPSFKITQCEMLSKKINNFLDLCYYFKDYTAIGTGYTRNLRNLIVMDIDVDSTKPENKVVINNLLLKFAELNSLPDFYIFNHESKHIQLQWLIQNYNYKDVDYSKLEQMQLNLNNDENKNREMGWTKTEFTQLSELGMTYRRFTLGLCEIVEGRRKFGDKNYTFWKAKNPMSALFGVCDLELKMPYYENGEIKFLSQDEMMDLFSDPNARKNYFKNAPTFEDIKENMSSLMNDMMSKVKEKKVEKIIDGDDVTEIKKKTKKNLGRSRNTFVLNCTLTTTWEIAKEVGYRKSDDIKNLPTNELDKFKRKVYNAVKKKYKEENNKYNGIWPDTTNISDYPETEFSNTFSSSFKHAVITYKNTTYSEDDRQKSLTSRHTKKDIKIIFVDKILNENLNLSRDELFLKVNTKLQEPISFGSFKRFLSESRKLTDESRKLLYDEYYMELDKRKKEWDSAVKTNKSEKLINTCKKRYEYLLIT